MKFPIVMRSPSISYRILLDLDTHVHIITRRSTDVMWVHRSGEGEVVENLLIEKPIELIQNLSNGFRETQLTVKST